MKIKQFPEDFVVKEIPNIKIYKKPRSHSVYILEKKGIDFITAKRTIISHLNIPFKNVAHAGIKDKKAITTQYITIYTNKGKKYNLKTNKLTLTHVGFSPDRIKSGDLTSNEFKITIRDLTKEDSNNLTKKIEYLKKFGFPNYFDSQRFGENLTSHGFIAKHLMKEEYEIALNLFFTPSTQDNEKKKKAKKIISSNWDNWHKCHRALKPLSGVNEEKKVIAYLKDNKDDFITAFKLIDLNKRELLVSAYQSYIWNETLKRLLKNKIKDLTKIKYKVGNFLFYNDLENDDFNYLKKLEIPMISPKLEIKDSLIKEITDKILEEQDLVQSELKVKKMRNLFFKARPRNAIVFPKNLEIISKDKDKANKDKFQLILSFTLDKGCYATILLKHLEKI